MPKGETTIPSIRRRIFQLVNTQYLVTNTQPTIRPARAIAAALLLAALICAGAAYGDTLRGRVVAIADGDTITVLDAGKTQHRIRLAGIDAPERGQAFGQASKRRLSELVFDREVSIEFSKLDRNGRIVGPTGGNVR
jgi:endonuclease YncB( thermonuclease family)